MLERDALATLRRIGHQMTHALQRSCKSGELLTFVSKERLERWRRELVDVDRTFTARSGDAEAVRRWRRPA